MMAKEEKKKKRYCQCENGNSKITLECTEHVIGLSTVEEKQKRNQKDRN